MIFLMFNNISKLIRMAYVPFAFQKTVKTMRKIILHKSRMSFSHQHLMWNANVNISLPSSSHCYLISEMAGSNSSVCAFTLCQKDLPNKVVLVFPSNMFCLQRNAIDFFTIMIFIVVLQCQWTSHCCDCN